MIKQTALFLTSLAVGAGAYGQDIRSSYSVTADFSYVSEYVFRGLKSTGDAFQPSVELAVNDFYVGLWTSQPITKSENNEIDIYGGYKYAVNNDFSLEAVAAYYWYPEARGGDTRDSFEVGIGGTYTMSGFSPSLYAYYDFVLEAATVQANLGYSLPLEALGASLDFAAYIGTVQAKNIAPDSGLRLGESYNYWGASVNLPYRLSDRATATVGANWANNASTPAGTHGSRLWVNAGVTVGF